MNDLTAFYRSVAEQFAEKYGLTVVDGTLLRVKTTPTHHIDLMLMFTNWRLVTSPVNGRGVYDRGWCFTGRAAFVRALVEAEVWPDDDGVQYVPDGWYKTAHGGGPEIRREEWLLP